MLGGTDPIASVPGEIVPGEEFYSYEDKYVTDGAQLLVPAPLTDGRDRRGARDSPCGCSKCCACDGLARVDFFYEDRPVVASCATRSTRCRGSRRSRCTRSSGRQSGVSYPELIDRLVDLALERHAHRRRNTKH